MKPVASYANQRCLNSLVRITNSEEAHQTVPVRVYSLHYLSIIWPFYLVTSVQNFRVHLFTVYHRSRLGNIVIIFLSINSNACFGCLKEPSH